MSYRITDLQTGTRWARTTRGEVDDTLDMLDPDHEERDRYEVKHYD